MLKPNSEVERLTMELHRVAARLAGVEAILRQNVEEPNGNSLHLLAEVTFEANSTISICADKLSNAMTGGAA